MRPLVALALVLIACGPSDRERSAAEGAVSAAPPRGPDPLLLRVPRTGGRARAYRYPELDSAVWRSAVAAPPIDRMLAFDEEAGQLAFVDTKGLPGRIDLRLGGVSTATKTKLLALSSVDGSAIFGITAKGTVTRLTLSGNWSFTPDRAPRSLIPQPDGSLLILTETVTETLVWRVRPPDERITDSIALPKVQRTVRTLVGDRVYFTVDSGLIGVRSKDLTLVPSVRLKGRVRSLSPTPSGDRLYVVTDSSREISVIDRYSNDIETRVELPGIVRDLRMDPLGRYLLARPASGDSAWVIAIATNRLVGAVGSAWRNDLPLVAPDGAILLVEEEDVRLVDGETLRPARIIRSGAKDLWYAFFWNGFRPRASVLDEPVTFAGEGIADTPGALPSDSTDIWSGAVGGTDTSNLDDEDREITNVPAPTRPAPPRAATPTRGTGFMVSFAALLDEEKARDLAMSISVAGERPRIIASEQAGGIIHRVVLGPYRTRADAERIGRAAGRDFWVYEERP